MVAIDRAADTQRWAYPLLLILQYGVTLGVSGIRAPLYGIYETDWHLSRSRPPSSSRCTRSRPWLRCWCRAGSRMPSAASRC